LSKKELKNIDVLINDYRNKMNEEHKNISKAEGQVKNVMIEKLLLLDDFINILEEFKYDGFYSEEHGIFYPEN